MLEYNIDILQFHMSQTSQLKQIYISLVIFLNVQAVCQKQQRARTSPTEGTFRTRLGILGILEMLQVI